MWRGRKEAQGGHFLIAWPKVTKPKELGGLGISDLKNLGRALRVRWPWLQKSEPLPMQTSACVQALLSMALATKVGDGRSTLFWRDRWILGQRMEELCPLIFSMVPKRISNKRTVHEAITDMRWIQDIHGAASIEVILEFIKVCDIILDITLQPGVADVPLWRLSSSGQCNRTALPRRWLRSRIILG
ncbi:hypothetical protein PR202_ga20949 [Eleusine coracana subsp. coracana]|uniref:Uncharacterized protein n=1 Tax=Eleusine coracana subsp. coracana TaxID=191504 RepID=A0AAV5CZD5_ELECO|nr:hypothetical protein PR202_ga20949 [Eleusine coracana subsp. coracana]